QSVICRELCSTNADRSDDPESERPHDLRASVIRTAGPHHWFGQDSRRRETDHHSCPVRQLSGNLAIGDIAIRNGGSRWNIYIQEPDGRNVSIGNIATS